MVGFKKHSKVAQSLILGITLRSFKDVISSCPSNFFCRSPTIAACETRIAQARREAQPKKAAKGK